MEEVNSWLCSNGLGEYFPKFKEHGWEELSLLPEMSDSELVMCITKPGHRAKFRKALRALAGASGTCGMSVSSYPAAEREGISCKEGAVSKEGTTDTTSSSLAPTNTVTAMSTTSHETESIETVRDVTDGFKMVDTNRSEEYINVTTTVQSTATEREIPRLGETRMESYANNELSLSSDLVGVDRSYTVIDNMVLEGSSPHLMNKGPLNLTIIEHSENTTVTQGPTQLHVVPDTEETKSPAAILKGQMEMLADSYRSKDHLFVETKAYNELKSVVEEMHWATLLGKSGDGKSATAAHLLLQYRDRGYDPAFLSSPRDWKMLISDSSSSKQVAVIDDMFGTSYLDDNKNVGKWKSLIESMSRIVQQRKGNLVVICTSRRYIFKDVETALKKVDCFSKHSVVDMTDEQYKLSENEKVAIFQKCAENYNIETGNVLRSIRYVDPPHGFPHCVELYCTDSFLRKGGITFFKNPVQYVQREICNFRDNDRVKFLVLLLVLHKGNKLELDFLDRLTENTTDDEKNIFQTAGVSLETAIPEIQRALNGLTNTYLKQNKDGSYSFSHHSLIETLAFIFISANPSHATRVLDFQHIIAFTNIREENSRGAVSKVCLPFEQLSKRMISEIREGNVSTVCNCEVWRDKMFVIKWLKRIENEQLAFLEAILCSRNTSIRRGKSESLLVCLIKRKRNDAAITLLENKAIAETFETSDLWLKCLQAGLETACRTNEPNMALLKTLVSIRYGENRLKLDGSKLLRDMLYHSNAEGAICLIEHTSIMPAYGKYFHVLALSNIKLSQFEVLCKMLLQAGVDINQIGWNDVPAVFICLYKTLFEDNEWNRLVCMVNNGADIHKQTKQGNIVLFAVNYLPAKRCLKVLAKLSDLDVDFHCTDRTGSNALHILCLKQPDGGSLALLHYLLNKGVNSEHINGNGEVPLMLALSYNFGIDFINTLAENVPPKHVNKSGQGYFHYLLSSNCITDDFCSKCEILLKLGASVDVKDNLGKPPIVQLMEGKWVDFDTACDIVQIFQFLYEHGMDLHAKDDHGRNIALYVLRQDGDVLPLLRYFYSIGLDLNLSDNDGRNALHYLFAKAFYSEKVLEDMDIKSIFYQVIEREFPEASGIKLKSIYDFLSDVIGVSLTGGDKNGINPVMLALENCAGFSWIKDLLELDISMQEDNEGKNYFHYLVKSRASNDQFEILKTALIGKGLTVNEQIMKDRPKPVDSTSHVLSMPLCPDDFFISSPHK